MRTLILDKEGNAVITTNDKFDKITIMVGEYYIKGLHIPSKQFSIETIDSIKAVRDYLNSVITKGEKIAQLEKEHKKLSEQYLVKKDEKLYQKIKQIKSEFIKLRGKTASNGKIHI